MEMQAYQVLQMSAPPPSAAFTSLGHTQTSGKQRGGTKASIRTAGATGALSHEEYSACMVYLVAHRELSHRFIHGLAHAHALDSGSGSGLQV